MSKVPVQEKIVRPDGVPTENFVFFLNDLLQLSGGGTTPAKVPTILEILHRFKTSYYESYSEYTYSGDKITAIDVWKTASKSKKLFEETITYTGDKVTKIEIKDILAGKTLRKSYTYSGDKISSIELKLI